MGDDRDHIAVGGDCHRGKGRARGAHWNDRRNTGNWNGDDRGTHAIARGVLWKDVHVAVVVLDLGASVVAATEAIFIRRIECSGPVASAATVPRIP